MPEIVIKDKYDWKITLKKMLISAVQIGAIAVIPVVLNYLQMLQTNVPIEYSVYVGLGVAVLTGVLNWLKHNKK